MKKIMLFGVTAAVALLTGCTTAKERKELLPALASGEIKAPPSKSCAHRLLICASLAKGKSPRYISAFSSGVLLLSG